ncbi:LysR family transcriptional regulator [Halomonas elongata]|uniref:LysR family transcriptional regulator n=1 Tax=Halomonas elongata TaxID=2746 RepID=UPI00186B90C1|nr:LysR family transcriptional regulator [Halomonas elongata]MBW5802181.1 LysR family transcriptional regulator [Halomonas elongata]
MIQKIKYSLSSIEAFDQNAAMNPKTTLDHWNVFKTVVEQGSFHKAAEHLERSQSTVSYAVRKLQEQLGASLIEIRGRKAVLTPIGELLLEDGKAIVEGMLQIEGRARSLAQGHELKVRLCVESCVPRRWVLDALPGFRARFPNTLLDVEFLTPPALLNRFHARRAELYLLSRLPPDDIGDELCRIRLACVASPAHPLARQPHPLSRKDLALSQVIRCEDADEADARDGARDRFTSAVIWRFNRYDAAIEAIREGLGYGWVPECMIRDELADGRLVPLRLAEGGRRSLPLQLLHRNRHGAGPATLHLAEALASALGPPDAPAS